MKQANGNGFHVHCERPEEEISFDVSVCSAEFPEGCKKPASEQLEDRPTNGEL